MLKNFILIGLLSLGAVGAQSIKAQPTRGAGNVRVTNASGQTQDVKFYDGSYALIIGESDYTNGWDKLPGVKNDVVAVKTALEKQGFQVRTVLNPKSYDLTKSVEDFISDYGYIYGNRLLIYFAGHGHTQKTGDGRDFGYIIPSDAPLPEADALEFQRKAVSMDTIQFYARKIQAKHALFVFDSCFSGKLVSRSNIAIPPFIAANIGQSVRQFITSGAANQTVPDESDFRKIFIRALEGSADEDRDGFILGSELAKYLKRELTNYSGGRQTPQYGKILDVDLDQGDFVFILPKFSAPAPPVIAQNNNTAQVPSSSGEKFFWEMIENSTDINDFENYLNRVRKGDFSGVYQAAAELKISKLKGKNAVLNWNAVSGLAVGLKKYQWVSEFVEDRALVIAKKNGEETKLGFIDRSGVEVIPAVYELARDFSEGLAAVQIKTGDKKKFGFIDRSGKTVIPFQYDMAGSFSSGLAPVGMGDFIDGQVGFINQNNTAFIPLKYGGAGEFRNGLAFVRRGSYFDFEYGFIDDMGREVIPLKFGNTNGFSDDVAIVKSDANKTLNSLALNPNDKQEIFQIINRKGEILATLKGYWYIKDFKEGLAGFRLKEGKAGFIDKKGNVVIQPIYDSLGDFEYGYAIFGLGAANNMKFGLLDRAGNIVISAKYDRFWCTTFSKSGIYGVEINGRKGFVDIYGNEFF